ncbi:MAG: DUF4352 domain-containing protein [Chloroflexi bacterium]|nr:MAG: DUF4352 domain-containing protein [Chloroflexota bacterium]
MTSPETPKQNIFANRSVVILAAVAGLALLTVIILLILLLRPTGENAASDPTLTPFPTGVGSALNEPLVVGIDGNSTITVTTDTPVTLALGGRSFTMQTQAIAADQAWNPNLEDEDTAVWVFGSIVNYVVGIPSSDDNRALLEGLQPGDEMTLTTRGGVSYTFSFDNRQLVSTVDQNVFAQRTPGVTLLMIGDEGNERLVVNGRYLVSEATAGQSNIIQLGESAQLDNIQISVPSVSYMPDRAEVPNGFAFFQIDYEIQNVGLTAFDSNLLRLTLIDNIGNQYALNPTASQIGNFPALNGFLNSGQVMQATAGYQIPLGLSSETMNWVVARSDTGAQIQVNLPFTGSPSAAAASTSITLLQADVASDLTSLILTGQVTNLNNQPIVITETDISLTSPDGSNYLLVATNPPFPWSVPAGQTLQFAVTYQRPMVETAVFNVLSQSFQLSGLR